MKKLMKMIIIIIGERAKRARHSQVCSIENRGYIYYNSASEAMLTNRRENYASGVRTSHHSNAHEQ